MNPYDPPPLSSSEEDGTDANLPPTRPIGVAILAVLCGLLGIAIGALLVFIANADDNEQWLERRGLPYALFAVMTTTFVLLTLACSVGMWFGAKWAWWLAALYYFSMLFGDLCQLLVIAPIKALSQDSDDVLLLVVRQGSGALINFALLRYMFKANVLRFFYLSTLRKVRALGILFGITAVFFVAVSTIVFVHLIRNRM